MIHYLSGTLVAATPLQAIVEVAGVGYEVQVPVTTAERLPGTGQPVKLHTLAVYREDAHTLYGFFTAAERDFFRLMVDKVQNVGPKVALAVLSHFTVETVRGAILSGDAELLSKARGVGRKTAERIILDLKGAVTVSPGGLRESVRSTSSGASANAATAGPDKLQDAALALSTLGFKPADAELAVRRALTALGAEASTEALVRRALSGG